MFYMCVKYGVLLWKKNINYECNVNRVLKKIPVHMKAKVSRQFRTLCDETLCAYTGYQLLL